MDIFQKQKVAVWRDLVVAAVVALVTVGVWAIVFVKFGELSKLDTGLISFLGGLLAISGLLFKHYMLKEVLAYLKSWETMRRLLSEIITLSLQQQKEGNPHVVQLREQEKLARGYSQYVVRELNLVPLVPLILIFLYGCALLSEGSFIFRATCLFFMIHLVSYLAIAAVSSNKLACSEPDLQEAITELENLRQDLLGGIRPGVCTPSKQ
jgi:hypothetical protein